MFWNSQKRSRTGTAKLVSNKDMTPNYSTNDLIDTDHAIILVVEATRAIRPAEFGANVGKSWSSPLKVVHQLG